MSLVRMIIQALSSFRRFAALLLVLLLAGAGCEEGDVLDVAWSRDGRWLAYVRGSELYIAPVTKARALPAELVAKNVVEPHLSWSPTAEELLFTSTKEGGWDIWRARLGEVDRWELKRVTDHPAKDWGAVFLPDGRRLAYLSYRGEQCDVWVQPVEGGSPDALTQDPAQESALSFGSDRALLYYLRTVDEDVYQLRAVDVNYGTGGVVAEGLRHATEAAASPSGRRVAVVAEGTVLLYWAEPGQRRGPWMEFFTRGWDRVGAGRGISWSHGGDRLLFVDGSGHVRVLTLEGNRASWDGVLRGRVPRLDPTGQRLARVVDSSFAETVVPGGPPSPRVQFILVLEHASGSYQCVCAEKATLFAGARAVAALGDFEAEAALLKEALGSRPSEEADPRVLTAYILALGKVGRASEAIGLAQSHLEDEFVVGVLNLAYTGDFGAARRSLALSSQPEGRELAGALGELDEGGRRLLGDAVRYEVEEHWVEALAAYGKLLSRPLSEDGRSVLALRAGRLEEETGRLTAALRSYRWVVRRGGSRWAVAQAVCRGAQVAERLGLRAEALRLNRLGSLYAQGPEEAFASMLDHVRLCLEMGTPAGREQAHAWVREELIPTLSAQAVSWDDGLATAYLFDLYGEHLVANELLAAMFADAPATEGALLQAAALALPWLPPEAVFEVRPGSIPQWLSDRLLVVCQGLGKRERELLGILLGLADAPVDLLSQLWPPFDEALAGLGSTEALRARLAGRYILGNRALGVGRTAEAVVHFARLCELAEVPSDAAHFQELAGLVGEDPEAVRDWLLALRDARLLFWGEVGKLVSRAARLTKSEEAVLLSGFTDRLPRPPEFAQPGRPARLSRLNRFSDEHPDWPLRAAFFYHRASLLPGRQRSEALRELLRDYPATAYWNDACRSMVEGLEHWGNSWLAARWLEGLVAVRPDDCQLLHRIAELYRSPLREFADAVPWARRAAEKDRGKPAWPASQWTLVQTLGEAKHWAEQAEAVGEFLSEAGDSKWVQSGDAQLVLAQALEQAGEGQRAEDAYLKLIEQYPKQTRDGKLLVELIPRLSISGLRWLYQKHPDMLRGALPELSRGDRRRVLTILPELRQ